MIEILKNTPIEEYQGVYVKREDKCAPSGAPPFSKIRGLVKHLEMLKQKGYIGVAYVETSVSMAGWGIAWACHQLDMKSMIFNPVYKSPIPLLQYHHKQWLHWGAELYDIPAGRAKVNYYIAKKKLPDGFKLLPLGLPLSETISETYLEASSCIQDYKSIVVCVGSGTIATGIFQATKPGQTLYGILSRSGNIERKKVHIIGKNPYSFFSKGEGKLELIDMGWEYATPCTDLVPFPCHPYYDAKAWQWLMINKEKIKSPILFWNIGSTGKENEYGI